MNEHPTRVIEWYGYNETILSPVGIGFVIVMALLFFLLPRRYALLPIIATACFITHRQRIVLGGLDFSMLRILVVVGLIRIWIKSEYRLLKINQIDKMVTAWVFVSVITGTLLWLNMTAFINRLGMAYDAIGLYFLSRIFISDFKDIERMGRALIIFGIPIAFIMINEQHSGRNFFSFLGGIPEFTMERDGRLRSQAAFSHPILAGTYGAYIFPLVVGLWQLTKQWSLLIIGSFVSIIIVITSASSGPLIALGAGFIGLCAWPFRMKTRLIFWSVVATLFGLHLIMKAPVWHLIGRIVAVSGSTSWHRVRLITAAVERFDEWYVFGTKNTAHWGWGLQDTTNMYVTQGIQGGILKLTLFVTVIILSFKVIGRLAKMPFDNKGLQFFIWSIGTSFFVHVVSFIGVSYFGQFIFFMYLHFAIISTMSSMNDIDKLLEPIPPK